MASEFSSQAFLEELDSFGKPPPQQKLIDDGGDSLAREQDIAEKLNAIILEKQKKIRAKIPPSTNGMATLGSRLNGQKKEEISLTEAEKWRQQVINANRPKNIWLEQQTPSPDSSREYARSVAGSSQEFEGNRASAEESSRSSTAVGSLPSPPGNGRFSAKHSDYSSASSYKSPSPPSTLPKDGDYHNPFRGEREPNYVNVPPNYNHSHPHTHTSGSGRDSVVAHLPTVVPFHPNTGDCASRKEEIYERGNEEFPKVDIMSPLRCSSSPSTSDYGSELPNRPYPTRTDYGSLDAKMEKNGLDGLPRSSRVARWKEIDSVLHRQDAQFSRLTEQLAEEMEWERKNKVKIGNCKSCLDVLYASDDVTVAGDRKFHPKCFNCETCGRNLREMQYFLFDGKILCKEDFLLAETYKNSEKCASCKQPIVEMVLQALEKSFHPHCFTCTVCRKSLDGVPFAVDNKQQVYCMPDYHDQFAPHCASCRKAILPKNGTRETIRVVALDKDYHVDCYVCEGCKCQLTDDSNERCYPLDGHLLCISCNRLWRSTGGAPITDL